MKHPTIQWIIILVACIALALIQSTDFVNVFGVKPDLLLVGLIVAIAFVPTFIHYCALVILGVLSLRFSLTFGKEFPIVGVIALVAFFISERLPGKAWINMILLIVIGTVAWYFLVDSSFIPEHPGIVFQEIAYNSIVGMALFWIAKRYFAAAPV